MSLNLSIYLYLETYLKILDCDFYSVSLIENYYLPSAAPHSPSQHYLEIFFTIYISRNLESSFSIAVIGVVISSSILFFLLHQRYKKYLVDDWQQHRICRDKQQKQLENFLNMLTKCLSWLRSKSQTLGPHMSTSGNRLLQIFQGKCFTDICEHSVMQ